MRPCVKRMAGWVGAGRRAEALRSMGPFGVAPTKGQQSNGPINPTALAQMQPAVDVPIGSGGPPRTGTVARRISLAPGGLKGGAQADFDSLINLIQSTIGPPTIWRT